MRLQDLSAVPRLPSGIYLNREQNIYFGLGLWDNVFFKLLPSDPYSISVPLSFIKENKRLSNLQIVSIDLVIALCRKWNDNLIDYKDFMTEFEKIERDVHDEA